MDHDKSSDTVIWKGAGHPDEYERQFNAYWNARRSIYATTGFDRWFDGVSSTAKAAATRVNAIIRANAVRCKHGKPQ